MLRKASNAGALNENQHIVDKFFILCNVYFISKTFMDEHKHINSLTILKYKRSNTNSW